MRLISLFLLIFLFSTVSNAQIDIKGKIKSKVNQRVDEKIDKEIDKGLDKAEQEAEGKDDDNDGKEGSEPEAKQKAEGAAASAEPPTTKSYSKFDFVPGEKVVYYDDLSQTAIGDFPGNWNTSISGEVVTLNTASGKWLMLKAGGVYIPEAIAQLPDNFTLEFDMVMIPSYGNAGGFQLDFVATDPNDKEIDGIVPGFAGAAVSLFVDRFTAHNWENHSYGAVNSQSNIDLIRKNAGKVVKVSVWRQKERLRLYVNENKVFDLPRIFLPGKVYNQVRFFTWDRLAEEDNLYIGNLRLAVGAPDTRNKLLTEGKLVTRGILFDVNSDKIKPESYGTLKDISNVLKESPDVRVKIIGHTDSDGADAANLELSKKRAAAVKQMLSTEFGVAAARMETDGKGEAEPAGPNTTAEGKANNRRVEFVKL